MARSWSQSNIVFARRIGTSFCKSLKNSDASVAATAPIAGGVFEDAADEGRLVENFLVASWMEHLRQHERVTNADRLVQECVVRFHLGEAPKVTHFIAAGA